MSREGSMGRQGGPLLALILALILSPSLPSRAQLNGSQLLEEARRDHRAGKLTEALSAYQAARPLLEQEKNLAGLALCLNNSSVILYGSGEFDLALKLARQAVRLRLDQGDVHLAGRSWTNAGRALAALGRIAAAEEAYGQALQAAQQDGDVRDQVVNLVNLGVLALNQGRYGDALTAIAAGLKLVEEAGEAGWTRSQKQILLNNRGVIYERIGEFRRALDDYKELLALLGPDRASVPYRINMAAILRNLGDPNLALEQLKKAEALLDSGSDPALMANLLSNVGLVEHLDLRRLKTALAVLERAYELAGQAGHPAEKQTIGNALADAAIDANRIDLARQTLAGLLDQIASGPLLEEAWKTHLEMARLLRAAGDGAGSIRALETAATLLEGSRSNLDVRFPSRRFLVDRMDVYARLAEELAGGAHRDLNAALAASERARQHLLLSRWRRHSPADGRPEKTAESLAELSAAAARSYENATPARLRTWREINQRLRPTRTDRFPPLPPQVAVVEFLLAGSHSRVFWRNGGTAGSLDLPLEKRLAGMVSRWLSALAAAAQDPGQERKTGWDLFQVLLQPVLARLPASVRRLWIVPDGGLWRLPWDALPLAGEIHAPRLVQKYELALLPSLAFASNSPTPRNPGAAGAYLFFGPPDPAPPGLRPLPGADAEAAALEQAWPEGGSIKTGRWATEGQFRRSLVQPVGLLHLATHAVVNPLDAGGTGIFFSRGQAADGALALRSLSRDDDGFLSLPEILHLDLDVGLAFLSACSGQAGESIPGEGLLSLSTALEEAGASAVIASLWDVEDLPTQALVEQFYFQLGQGSTAAQALRDAKLALLNAGGQMAQPSRWAGWVIIGRGEIQLKPRSSHLLRYAAGAAVLALLLLAAWLFIRQFGLRARA